MLLRDSYLCTTEFNDIQHNILSSTFVRFGDRGGTVVKVLYDKS